MPTGTLKKTEHRHRMGLFAQFFGGVKLVKAGKIHELAALLFKPRGSKRRKKVAAYSPEITVDPVGNAPLT